MTSGEAFCAGKEAKMNRLMVVIVLVILPMVEIAKADSATPLLHLLEQIPRSAPGLVSLSDITAAKRQIAPLAASTPSPTRELVPYTALYDGVNELDLSTFGQFAEHGGRAALGFSIFGISRMAAWGRRPAMPVIIDGVAAYASRIEAALLAREFKATEYKGYQVWYRGRDHESYNGRHEDDPFSAGLNSSQRLCVNDGFLLFSRSWSTMHEILDAESSLADEPDVVAIVRAGYMLDGVGDLIDAVLLPGQPETTSTDVPTLPAFNRYGLLLWQSGAMITGGIAIPYAEAAIAETARDRFVERLATLKAPSVRRPFLDFLPWPHRIEIIEFSDLSVLIIGFQSTADISQSVNLMTFMRNPRRTLVNMVRNHDMNSLIGHSR